MSDYLGLIFIIPAGIGVNVLTPKYRQYRASKSDVYRENLAARIEDEEDRIAALDERGRAREVLNPIVQMAYWAAMLLICGYLYISLYETMDMQDRDETIMFTILLGLHTFIFSVMIGSKIRKLRRGLAVYHRTRELQRHTS
ncbi:MAG: hypothetical protein QOJ19_1217 [Acidimicrobiia bacterium]|nr:hypothetical protein [Acidimicrobiia bacterium]